MMVMHEYPLAIVDHAGFKRFVHSLNSNFKLISWNTLKGDIMKMHSNERMTLKKLFEDYGARIAITTDMWIASHQKRVTWPSWLILLMKNGCCKTRVEVTSFFKENFYILSLCDLFVWQ